MSEFFQLAFSQTNSLSIWEGIAVLLAIAYLLLALRENILCWYCALVSTTIYIYLFWNVSLLMESALNIFYLIMAVYGWYQWQHGGSKNDKLNIRQLSIKQHGLIIIAVFIMTFVSGSLLTDNSNAAWPYIDSFTTWGSVVTTFMVAKKYLENWLYWIIIDGISIPLYIDRGLYLTAMLFMLYIIIVICGYLSWHKRLIIQNTLAANA